MLIILESVRSVFDTSNMCVHPQDEDGGYNKDCNFSMEEINLSSDWFDTLSVEDYDTVTSCI